MKMYFTISKPFQYRHFWWPLFPKVLSIATQPETCIDSGLRNCIPFSPHFSRW